MYGGLNDYIFIYRCIQILLEYLQMVGNEFLKIF